MTQIGRDAIPKRSPERPHLLYLYVALRLISFLLEDYTCLQSAVQIWLIHVLIFSTVNLNWADVAWGCDILQRWGTNCGGNFISYISHESDLHKCCWCIHEHSLAFGDRGIGKMWKTEKVLSRFSKNILVTYTHTHTYTHIRTHTIHTQNSTQNSTQHSHTRHTPHTHTRTHSQPNSINLTQAHTTISLQKISTHNTAYTASHQNSRSQNPSNRTQPQSHSWVCYEYPYLVIDYIQ